MTLTLIFPCNPPDDSLAPRCLFSFYDYTLLPHPLHPLFTHLPTSLLTSLLLLLLLTSPNPSSPKPVLTGLPFFYLLLYRPVFRTLTSPLYSVS